MRYHSTRNAALTVNSAQAVLEGLAPDGGLYMPESIPAFDWQACLRGSSTEMSAKILAALLPDIFAEGEVDRIYINFCDPWPTKRHAKRRLTHTNFLKLYRKVLKEHGQIHFKTDNAPLFEFSLEEFPQAGFSLSEVTRNLHESGPCGVMTDYEAKFYELGTPINRCVATMEDWVEPVPSTDVSEDAPADKNNEA